MTFPTLELMKYIFNSKLVNIYTHTKNVDVPVTSHHISITIGRNI